MFIVVHCQMLSFNGSIKRPMSGHILDLTHGNHPAEGVVRDMQQSASALLGWDILATGGLASAIQNYTSGKGTPLLRGAIRAAKKLKASRTMLRLLGLRDIPSCPGPLFVILMSYGKAPYARGILEVATGPRGMLLFDAWEPALPSIRDALRDLPLEYLFVTSQQSAEALGKHLPGFKVEWLPESLADDPYPDVPLQGRTVDVVQFGRKYAAYHDQIVGPLANAGIQYRFERTPGEIIAPTHEDFVHLITQSKVSICFPRSVTHPEVAGSTETMTLRFLQSFAAGTLVVGHAPREMVELFGYNPIVEAEPGREGPQLIDIVEHIEDYTPLIQRNLAEVENHRWARRLETIRARLEAN